MGDTPWQKFYKPGKRVRAIAPNAGGRRVLIGNQAFNASRRRVEDVAMESHGSRTNCRV